MLYSSMTDQHQEVRAAAASVYGKVTEHLAPDDLPKLFTNTGSGASRKGDVPPQLATM
jgi:hypothetical protein